MAKNIKTHLFCYDDHRGFTEEVRKRFTDTERYTVLSFQTREDFMKQFEKEKEHKFCKIAILGLHDNEEQWNMIEKFTADIKRTDHSTGLILIGSGDKLEEIKKSIKFNIDAYIPKNANSVLRIHNTVKKLISEHSIGIFRRRRNFSVYAVLGFLLLSFLLIALAYFKFPQYF